MKKMETKMMRNILCLGFLALFFSCGDDSEIGLDVIGDEDLNVQFTDDFLLTTRTIFVDSVETFTSTDNFKNVLLLGELNDEYFGNSKASIFTELHTEVLTVGPPFNSTQTLDSMIVRLVPDSLGSYGNRDEIFDIRCNQVSNEVERVNNVYSSQPVEVEMLPFAERSTRIPLDSFFINDPIADSLVLVRPQIRIPVEDNFALELFNNDSANENDSTFIESFRGLVIEGTPEANSLVGLNMGQTRGLGTDNLSQLIVYYSDTIARTYSYDMETFRFNNFEHDYTGSIVEQFSEDPLLQDSLVFLQSLSGVDTEIDISDIARLGDILLNKVQLELTLADFPEIDLVNQPAVPNIFAFQMIDGERRVIEDIQILQGIDLVEINFGGVLLNEEVEGQEVLRYRLNITQFVQEHLDGENDGLLILSAFLKDQRSEQSVIFGPKSSRFPLKMRVTFTAQ